MISLDTLRSESPITIAREAVWRAQKRWRANRSGSIFEQGPGLVEYRNVPYYSPDLDSLSDSDRQILCMVADQICAGEFCILGYDRAALGFPPEWNVDFVSKETWDLLPQASVVRVRFDGSDVKVPWELSRLQFLPVLGKAYTLTGSERYREAAKDLLSDWILRNPAGMGVNWTLAMEAALRGMSMCFLLCLLWPLRADERGWLSDVTTSLWQHTRFIEANLEFSHFVRSNHYLSNIVGLCCLTAFLDGADSTVRFSKYKRMVEEEIMFQVREDGGDYESSTGYHLLVTQMFTSHAILMRALGLGCSDEFGARLRSMYRVLSKLADINGRLPNVGDCDDGRVEWLTEDLRQMQLTATNRNSLNIAHQLGIGSRLLGEDYGGSAADACWYGLDPRPYSNIPGGNRTEVFLESGMATARRGDAQLWFFNMPNGIMGKGSHTHNDKLSVVLTLGGTEFLCDSGTGVYTRDPRLRNHMRSTLAHNTISVDEAEQNRYALSTDRLFRMGDEAHPRPIECEEDEVRAVFTSSHNGYARIGVKHTRGTCLFADGLVIEDELRGDNLQHKFCVSYHIPQGWRVLHEQQHGDGVSFEIEGPQSVTLSVTGQSQLHGYWEPTIISRTYGTTIPATRLTISGTSALPLTLRTEIRWKN